ncbi:MAG: cytochrome P450 [Caldilineaceae bacterium]|nr:cytochrome P450 [Caldilineaceae bacterium]
MEQSQRAPGPLLSGQQFKADPYPTYAQLRAEAPVYCRTSADGAARMWFITRYEDVVAALRDHKRFVKDVRNTLTPEEQARIPAPPPLYQLLTHHMLNADGATHARLRALVNKAFAARRVERLEPRLRAIANELIDKVQPHGRMEIIHDFSLPFSITVIAELLGVPSRDHHRYRAWSRALVAPSADPSRNERKTARLRSIMEDFTTYLRRLCTERQRNPQDDLITSLLEADEAGDRLSEEELFSMVLLLTVVGHETSVYLIGNSVLTLLQHPDVQTHLRNCPEEIPAAIEELIRYDGPVERATMRFAAEDVELHGYTIRRGDAVSLVLASAHRDPAAFPDPDRLDLARDGNRHLGFGHGVHYCVGAPLARLEACVALELLLRRLPGLQLATPVTQLRWHTNPILRGARAVWVQWEERT